jgi:hypothetical protein
MNACGKGYQVNARSLQSAHKSISHIKERLPVDERLQFELAYWLVRDQIKNNDEFLRAIDGKTPKELIAMGKDNFGKRKANDDRADLRDKNGYPRVDYKLHAM